MMKTMEVMSEPLHPPGEHLVVGGHDFPAEGASGTAQLDCTIWIARLHIWIASTNQHPLKIKMPEDGIKKITKKITKKRGRRTACVGGGVVLRSANRSKAKPKSRLQHGIGRNRLVADGFLQVAHEHPGGAVGPIAEQLDVA